MAEKSPTSAKPRRGPGRPFKPGQSGNPGGRPRIWPAFREQCAAAAQEALAVVLRILRDRDVPPGDRLRAASFLVDRGFGRPPQAPVPPPEQKEVRVIVGRWQWEAAGRTGHVRWPDGSITRDEEGNEGAAGGDAPTPGEGEA